MVAAMPLELQRQFLLRLRVERLSDLEPETLPNQYAFVTLSDFTISQQTNGELSNKTSSLSNNDRRHLLKAALSIAYRLCICSNI